MTFRLLQAQYDAQTERAYVEFRRGDGDGANRLSGLSSRSHEGTAVLLDSSLIQTALAFRTSRGCFCLNLGSSFALHSDVLIVIRSRRGGRPFHTLEKQKLRTAASLTSLYRFAEVAKRERVR